MAHKIHFIWWGNPAPGDDPAKAQKYRDAAFTAPNALARAKPADFEIHYWFQAGHEAVFEGHLDEGIIRRPIRGFEVLTAFGEQDLKGKKLSAPLLEEILQSLHRASRYSAIKDLLHLLIVYVEGGHYFDTSMYAPGAGPFFEALRAPAGISPQFVLPDKGKGPRAHAMSEKGAPPYALMTYHPRKMEAPPVDYWALYAEPGDGMLKKALDSYLARCKYFFSGDRPFFSWRQPPPAEKTVTDTDVANLISYSVSDAFQKTYKNDYGLMLRHCLMGWVVHSDYKFIAEAVSGSYRDESLYKAFSGLIRRARVSEPAAEELFNTELGIIFIAKVLKEGFPLPAQGQEEQPMGPEHGLWWRDGPLIKFIQGRKNWPDIHSHLNDLREKHESELRIILAESRNILFFSCFGPMRERKDFLLPLEEKFLAHFGLDKHIFDTNEAGAFYEVVKGKMSSLAPVPAGLTKVQAWHITYRFFKRHIGSWRIQAT